MTRWWMFRTDALETAAGFGSILLDLTSCLDLLNAYDVEE